MCTCKGMARCTAAPCPALPFTPQCHLIMALPCIILLMHADLAARIVTTYYAITLYCAMHYGRIGTPTFHLRWRLRSC